MLGAVCARLLQPKKEVALDLLQFATGNKKITKRSNAYHLLAQQIEISAADPEP